MRRQWPAPAGLILLALVPVVAGAARVTQLTSGADVTEENARFFASPVPVVAHIIGATVFCVLGALQFVPGLRRHAWHRRSGRLVLPAGLVAALSGVWMTAFYPKPPDDELTTVFRYVFGAAMAAFLVLGFLAVRQRDFDRHRAWMMRGYAIGIGAGTQVFTLGPLLLLADDPYGLPRAIGHLLGWVLNLAVAEWIIRRADHRAVSPTPATA
ncbi:DUF2306 domain-containing protein [Luedemannella helvata]|uniref:DUF2306 domain-containing protein n=1 Tax=Luedemannella helvata TaxID=349315 RepID=A0ABN2K0V5_9ACTN